MKKNFSGNSVTQEKHFEKFALIVLKTFLGVFFLIGRNVKIKFEDEGGQIGFLYCLCSSPFAFDTFYKFAFSHMIPDS